MRSYIFTDREREVIRRLLKGEVSRREHIVEDSGCVEKPRRHDRRYTLLFIEDQRRHGYTSVSEFVKDAIRWYLKEISKSPLER